MSNLATIKRKLVKEARGKSWPREIGLWADDKLVRKKFVRYSVADMVSAVKDFPLLAHQGVRVFSFEGASNVLQKRAAACLQKSGFKSKADLWQQGKAVSDLLVVIPSRRQIVFDFDNSAFSRGANLFFIIGAGSSVAVIDRHYKKGGNGSVFVITGKKSTVDYFVDGSCPATQAYYRAHVAENSRFCWYAAAASAGWLHWSFVINQARLSSQGEMRVAFRGGRRSRSVVNLVNCHQGKNTTGDIVFKGVGTGAAWAKINGWIVIGKQGAFADSYLREDVLLLSDEASVKAEPNLEILNNEVMASHGATVGAIDEEQLFYLMSRGLSREQAERVIVAGFLKSLADGIENKEVRERFARALK